ncbi:MAG: hypothetical protein IKW04_01985 [Clostridia bacterium]|nr:hypothetical protein [Clostridia bacterium]
MKKFISMLLAGTMALSLCGCNNTQAPAPEVSQVEESGETVVLSEDEMLTRIQGWWYMMYEDSNDCFAIHFSGRDVLETMYPGEKFPDGVITGMTQIEENVFEVEIYYPETELFGEVYPESTDTYTLISDNGFQNDMVMVTEDGTELVFQYAGFTESEFETVYYETIRK